MLQNLGFKENTYNKVTDRCYETRPVKVSKYSKKQSIHPSKMTFKTAHVWNSTLNLSQLDGSSNFGWGVLISYDICIKWVFTHTRNRRLNLI